jgi:hypothetical protein
MLALGWGFSNQVEKTLGERQKNLIENAVSLHDNLLLNTLTVLILLAFILRLL